MNTIIRVLSILLCLNWLGLAGTNAQGVVFNGDISPAEGIIKPSEKPFRDEICLNGRWQFQPVAIPAGWVAGQGQAPELTAPQPGKWEATPIKIPSPWNVNEWGAGSKVGAGTQLPYAPSSVYYPSYLRSWGNVKMGWLKRTFNVPQHWSGKRVVIHFEAVMGEFVVMVNGREVARHFGDYMPFEVDVTEDVKPGQPNELLVGVRHRKLFDKTNAQYRYFRSTYPPGSNTDNLVGIWQDVYLQALPVVRVNNVFVKPLVDQDLLALEVEVINQGRKTETVSLGATFREWVRNVAAPEIGWSLGDTADLATGAQKLILKGGEKRKVTLTARVQNRLKYWTPDSPQLYAALITVHRQQQQIDCKYQRFGWRQFTIRGRDFFLNGKKIQCFADIQHPFGAYICSRRFAWAWFRMIKDVGGNSVRLHAQPWPALYTDLADEMGLMVLDEAALFGSSLSLNFGEDSTWERTARHIDALVMRDRNHPSVIGWSAGNELFAISLYNKPTPAVAREWEGKSMALARRPALLDPTRTFITDDGDEDMHGHLPVWSKHFSHGLTLDRLPANPTKPLVVGESGATYYGRPSQLVQFAGEKPYQSYEGRNEALAVDVYQNVVKMALPFLAYYSPSELCWFGIEHMNLGYSDYTRLPGEQDGIFAGKPYEEGKPGYQLERIPPYVTTFNPGLDPALPLYKPLPMFKAMKAALAKNGPAPSPWDHFPDTVIPRPAMPAPKYSQALFIGREDGPLARLLDDIGLNRKADAGKASLVIIDADNSSAASLQPYQQALKRIQQRGGLIWVLYSGAHPAGNNLGGLLPDVPQFTSWQTSTLQGNKQHASGKLFNLPDLYFSEMEGDKYILKQAITGHILEKGNAILQAAKTDWLLFNNAPENRKCAQVVLYEKLQRPPHAAMLELTSGNAQLCVSTIDYSIDNSTTHKFWEKLCQAMAIRVTEAVKQPDAKNKKAHDLLLDGPVN